jgi:hypothetical protein
LDADTPPLTELLDAIYAGQPFRTTLRNLGLTPNQVWGLTRTDEEWSAVLEAALTATDRLHLCLSAHLLKPAARQARNSGAMSPFLI